MVIIGLGTAGCKIASLLKKYKEYKVILLDADKGIPHQSTVEEYEENTPKFRKKLSFDEDEVWFIVCGAAKIAACSLSILEQIKHKKINIAYIYPETILATPPALKRNKVVYNILQEYTRSGLFQTMYLFDNKSISEIVGNTTLLDYHKKINETIAESIHLVNYYNNAPALFGSKHGEKNISRIKALSVGSIKKNEEKLYFPLDNITETGYIYNVSKEELQNSSEILTLMKDKIKTDKTNSISSSFTVFESPNDLSYYYSIKHTHYIQKEIK